MHWTSEVKFSSESKEACSKSENLKKKKKTPLAYTLKALLLEGFLYFEGRELCSDLRWADLRVLVCFKKAVHFNFILFQLFYASFCWRFFCSFFLSSLFGNNVSCNLLHFTVSNEALRGNSPASAAQVQQWIGFAENEILPASCTWVFPCMGAMQYNKQVRHSCTWVTEWVICVNERKGLPSFRIDICVL